MAELLDLLICARIERIKRLLLQEKIFTANQRKIKLKVVILHLFKRLEAQMAELVDALDSKSCIRKDVQVRFLFWALGPLFRGLSFCSKARKIRIPCF